MKNEKVTNPAAGVNAILNADSVELDTSEVLFMLLFILLFRERQSSETSYLSLLAR